MGNKGGVCVIGYYDTCNSFGTTVYVECVVYGGGVSILAGDEGGEICLVLQHLVEMVDTSGSLLGDTVASLKHLWVLGVHESSEVTAIVENEVQWLA